MIAKFFNEYVKRIHLFDECHMSDQKLMFTDRL